MTAWALVLRLDDVSFEGDLLAKLSCGHPCTSGATPAWRRANNLPRVTSGLEPIESAVFGGNETRLLMKIPFQYVLLLFIYYPFGATPMPITSELSMMHAMSGAEEPRNVSSFPGALAVLGVGP